MRPIVSCGDLVKDNITGFEGIVTAVADYRQGYQRVNVQSRSLTTEGKPGAREVFEVEEISLLKSGEVAATPVTYKNIPFNMGDHVKSTFYNNFDGPISIIQRSITGCITFGVTSRDLRKGKVQKTYMFDPEELILVQEKVVPEKPQHQRTGAQKMRHSSRHMI